MMVQTNALGMDKLFYKNAISFFLYSIMHTLWLPRDVISPIQHVSFDCANNPHDRH